MWASTLAQFDMKGFLAVGGVDGRSRTFKKGQALFTQGSRNDSIFFIESGTVKLIVTSSTGSETILAFLDGGHLVGESCMMAHVPVRLHSAIAVTDVRVCRIRREAWMRLLREQSRACTLLVVYLADVVAELEEELVSSLGDTSQKRLARALLSLARIRQIYTAELPGVIDQQTLADMIGTSRQRVNVLMKGFRKRGFVQDIQGSRVNESLRTIAGPDRLRSTNGKKKQH